MAHDLLTFRLSKQNGSLNRQVTGYRVESPLAPYAAIVPFGQQIQTRNGGSWVSENAARYQYWPDRWHNILTLYSPDRILRGLYCDIVTPAVLENGMVTATDLDFDVWVYPDLSYRVLDEDEFRENAETYGYPQHVIDGATTALAGLIADVVARRGLFADRSLFEISNAEWALMTGPPAG